MTTSGADGPVLLGGSAAPLGAAVGFAAVPAAVFVEAVVGWRRGLGVRVRVRELTEPYPACLDALRPLAPQWTRELVLEHADGWIAYLNNSSSGGDIASSFAHIGTVLGVECVLARHHPQDQAGHAMTQLELLGPDGEPPLMYRRSLSASAEDGRWGWYASGAVQAFEQPERYAARRVRDRFTRPLLVEYLRAMGIAADDAAAFRRPVLLTRPARVPAWRRWWVGLTVGRGRPPAPSPAP